MGWLVDHPGGNVLQAVRGVSVELGRKVWPGSGVLTVIRKQWGGGRKEEGDGRWAGPESSTLRVPLHCVH